MIELELTDDRVGRRKPPRHLADLTLDQRADAVEALGEPRFRAKQLSTHYFGRLTGDPTR